MMAHAYTPEGRYAPYSTEEYFFSSLRRDIVCADGGSVFVSIQ
jgi:hypothetical protein